MSRKVTDEDIKKYEAMVESYMRDYVVKNWNEASLAKSKDNITLGNTGMTMADIRQYLRMQVFIAITKYNPDFRTKEGRSLTVMLSSKQVQSSTG
jgi:deoxycytidine triphosphate deaminase